MNKFYDKILFVFALLVLLAGILYCKSIDDGVKSLKANAKATLAGGSKGESWKEDKVELSKLESHKWPVAVAQSTDKMWLYQLFTPPKIWIDSEGKFVVQPPNSEKKLEQTFGFAFGALKHEPYPIKYKGYFVIEEKGNPVYHIQLYDELNSRSMKGKVGEEIEVFDAKANKNIKTGITIKDFKKDTVRDSKTSVVITTERVLLRDGNLKKDIEIFSDKPTYIEESKALVLKSDATGENWEVKRVGETRKTEDSIFTIKELDLDKGTALVEKTSIKGDLAAQKMLLSKDGNKLIK